MADKNGYRTEPEKPTNYSDEVWEKITKPKIDVLFIEAGHGMVNGKKDPGAVGNDLTERAINKEMTLGVVKLLQDKKELAGVKIVLVGEDDITLVQKTVTVNTIAKKNDPKRCLSVSIHQNAGGGTGTECWFKHGNETAKKFAETIIEAYKKYNIIPVRPVPVLDSENNRLKRLYIQDWFTHGVLIENMFIDCAENANKYKQNPDRFAECLAHGILNFIKSL